MFLKTTLQFKIDGIGFTLSKRRCHPLSKEMSDASLRTQAWTPNLIILWLLAYQMKIDPGSQFFGTMQEDILTLKCHVMSSHIDNFKKF